MFNRFFGTFNSEAFNTKVQTLLYPRFLYTMVAVA
jgi:hypothetical protein